VIRVVLVDDQALVRTGLRMVLEAEPDTAVVGEAADGLQAVEAARLRPDLVLMDIRMPNLDRIEATRRLAGTDREREVLELVARGRSNAEIARDLVVGPVTVKTHVGRVLIKLGLRDRVEAVIWAYEAGLVQPGR
jgi:DNA-binding NarL/FixJ family response regulator